MSHVPMLLSELLVYVMSGWSFWLLGAALSLTYLHGFPMAIQIAVMSLQGFSCACIEFCFTYLLQIRLSLLEKGFGSCMGVQVTRRIRLFTMTCQLTFVGLGAHAEAINAQKALDWSYAAFHLIAAVGVLGILIVSAKAILSLTNAMREVPVPKQSFAKLEKDWSLNVLKRMAAAVLVSGSVSIASHLFCMHAILLVHGGFRPLLGTAYHVADIVAELAGLVFIVGILRPEMPDLLPPEARSMRGASRLLEECSSESVLWNAKVQELAHRSIDLESLLDFYEKLGSEVMKHFDPQVSTTADVVRQAVIPLSRVGNGGVAYTDYLVMAGKPSRQMPDCMVTHTWSSLFLHLVAAVVSDALELDEYHYIAAKISEGKLATIRHRLVEKGVLQNRYWICCFCVNQHASICNGVGKAPGDPAALARWERNRRDTATGHLLSFCTCSEPKVLNDQPDRCELNKFHVMMLWLQRSNPKFRQLVAVDCDFSVFERAWCVAELVAAHNAKMPQSVCLSCNKAFDLDAEDLSIYGKLTNLSVANSLSSRPEDKEMVLSQISSVPAFDAELQLLIFGNRGLLKQKFFGFDSLIPAARTARRLCRIATQNNIV